MSSYSGDKGPVVNSDASTPGDLDIAAEILQYWWSRRWYILRVMLAAIAVFALVLLLIPNLYRAQATVIVLPPRFMPEVRAQPLTVSTLRTLLGSGNLLQDVIEKLRTSRELLVGHLGDKNADDKKLQQISRLDEGGVQQLLRVEDPEIATYLVSLSAAELGALLSHTPEELAEMSVDDLGMALESKEAVEKKTASDLVFSPLVQLFATADTGVKAQLLANTWAFFFTRMYEDLTRVKTTEQYESIRNQQEISQSDLEDIQTTIVQYKSKHNMELLQKEIDQTTQEFQVYTQQLITKRTALEKLRGRMQQLLTVVAAMEQDGGWVGRVRLNASDLQTTDGSGLGAEEPNSISRSLERPEAGDWSERIRHETLQSRDRLSSAMIEFTRFYKERPLELLEKERDQMQTDYLAAQNTLRSGTIRLEVLGKNLQTLDERLSHTAPLLTLSTSVPEQTMADAFVQRGPQQVQALSGVQFQRQEVNPSWVELQTQRNTTQQELEIARNLTAELDERLPALEKQLKDLQNRIYEIRLNETFIKENLDRWQRNNDQLFRNYVESSQDVVGAAQEMALLEQEVRDIEGATSSSQARAEELQRLHDRAAADLQVLELRQRAIQRNADLLLQKMQEAQIAVRESVSDVSIASRAVAPERHYFPMRSLSLLLATIVTGFALLAGLARQRYLQLRHAGL